MEKDREKGNAIDLSEFDLKYVRIRDIYGETHEGLARYENEDFLMCEYGGEEDGLMIEDFLIYRSQIESMEEIAVHGTAEIWTERLVLRRYRTEDAEPLYEYLGKDPAMARYSGWNPYASPELAQATVRRFIDSYPEEHAYSWVMDVDDVVVGTIGAYDYHDGRIEVGFSVVRGWQGRGFATEALRKVLWYLTENEGIPCVTAWCAAENTGSRRAMEKAGMRHVRTEENGLAVGDKTYNKMIFEYRLPDSGEGRYRFYGWQTADVRDARGLTPRDYYDLLSGVWSAGTCAPRMRTEWTPENRTLGQCSITAFLLQDIYGGKVRGIPLGDGSYHCFNEVGDTVFDLTSEQFGDTILDYTDCPEQERSVHFAKEEKRLRYEKLKAALEERLREYYENPKE